MGYVIKIANHYLDINKYYRILHQLFILFINIDVIYYWVIV